MALRIRSHEVVHPRVMIVTGPRALVGVEGARDWVVTTLVEVCQYIAPDVVLVGDADGPDAWCREIAAGLPHAPVLFVYEAQSGDVVEWRDGQIVGTHRWCKDEEMYAREVRPLRRNERMCWQARQRDRHAHAVGFLYYGVERKTRGTEHTLSAAVKLGLPASGWLWGLSPAGWQGGQPFRTIHLPDSDPRKRY